ncbi:MAG: hypothetical protein FWE83_06230 [Oscillospiraceae bacterium]|nr:hypothetical protein [Oscillospiraceae bacterium]
MNVTIADTDPVPTIQGLINAAIATGATTIEVTGSKITANSILTLNIPDGVTIVWNAVYRGIANPVIDYYGDGTLNIGSGGWVQNTSTPNSYTAIRANGLNLIISGGTVQSGKGRAIEGAGPNTVVNVTSGSVFNEATSNLFPVIDMTNASNIGSVNVNVSGGNVFASSTAAGSYGYVIQSYGNVLISGGTLSTSGVYGRVVNLVGDSSNVTVSGGIVQATGSGGTAISTSTTAPTQVTNTSVTITGGLVASYATSGTGWAIHTTGSNSTVSVSGGTVFAYGTGITGSTNSVIYTERNATLGFTGATSNGIVIAWDRAAWIAGGSGVYFAPPTTPPTLSSTNIINTPLSGTGVTATWAKRDTSANRPFDGIYYSNGTNTGYIQLSEVTVVNQYYPVVITFGPGGTVGGGNNVDSTGSGIGSPFTGIILAQTIQVPYTQTQSFTVRSAAPYYILAVDTWDSTAGYSAMYFSQLLFAGNTPGETFNYTTPPVVNSQIIRVFYAQQSTTLFSIVAFAGVGGSFSPSGYTSNIPLNSTRTYTVTAQPGYYVTGVVVDGTPVTDILTNTTNWPGTNNLQSGSYTFDSISRNSVISATFGHVDLNITATASAGGSISPQGNVTVPYGGNQTFTITPDDGYFINEVLIDGVPTLTTDIQDFINVKNNHTISVTFALNAKPDVYDFSAIAGIGGIVSGTPSGYYEEGTAISVIALANDGYHFVNWTITGAVITGGEFAKPATFIMPADTVVITANFEQNPPGTFTLNVIGAEGGTLSGTRSGPYAEGYAVQVTAAPNPGFRFSGWTITGADITGGNYVNPAAFLMPGNMVTITASFEVIPPGGSPQTGVDSNIALPVIMLALGLLIITGAELYRREHFRKAKQK